MKSFIKNNIKVFASIIITTIIVGSVSVYAASQYFAKDITFTPTNENFKKENGELVDNVEDALNELYKNKPNGNIETIYDTFTVHSSQGLSASKTYVVPQNGKMIVSMKLFCGVENVNSGISYSVKKNNSIIQPYYVNTANWNRTLYYIFDVNKDDEIILNASASKLGSASSLGVYEAIVY